MRSLVTLILNIYTRSEEMSTHKKRLTITVAESVLIDLEKIAKEIGLSKSAVITIALEQYKKGQKWA
jgi:hypothetical protein